MKFLSAFVVVAVLVGCSSKKEASKNEPAPAPTQEEAAPRKQGDPLPALASNAPLDKPTTLDAQRQAKIAMLTAEAMKSYPDAKARYLKGLPEGESFFVVATLTSPGAKENVFIAVNGIKGSTVSGTIASEIQSVQGFHAGDAYDVAEGDLIDWLITKPDGSEEGNIVGKWLDTQP